MNKVFLSGNLTRDPEVRYSQNGMAFARMGIAVNRRTKNKDVKEVDFFNIVAFDKTAEFCGRYMTKGSRVLVEGRLQTSSYEKDGVKRTSVEIMVDNIEFASSKRADNDDDYRRNSRSDDDDYRRNSRSDDDDYRNSYRQPERDNSPKKSDDDFGGDTIDLEDPPF